MGKQINVSEETFMVIDIEHERAEYLRQWYQSLSNKEGLKPLHAKQEKEEKQQKID